MKLLMENWRSYRKQLLNEESKFAKELSDMDSDDQKLRNLFAKEVKEAGGWSQELLNQFVKKHGTSLDDVFGDRKNNTKEKFSKLLPKLDYSNFDDKDWSNFGALFFHLREPKYDKLRKKELSKIIKAGYKNWKDFTTDIARENGLLPELDGITIGYPDDTKEGGKVDLVLKKKGMTWEDLLKKLGVKI